MLGPPDSFCNAKLSFPSPLSFFSLQNSFNFVLLAFVEESNVGADHWRRTGVLTLDGESV